MCTRLWTVLWNALMWRDNSFVVNWYSSQTSLGSTAFPHLCAHLHHKLDSTARCPRCQAGRLMQLDGA
jgi:hypothetical protein